MKNRIERLRLVVMESPYDSWNHPLTEPLFGKMVGLKIKGYGRVYPYGVLAVDTTDLISDHLLICEETESGLSPLFGNKSVPLTKCELHNLPFSGLSVVEESNAPLHVQAMKRIIADSKKNGVDLRYAGSMTIHPDETGNKEWSLTLRELFTTLYVRFYQSLQKAEVITGATLRFKVQNYTGWLGHQLIEHNGAPLGAVQVAHLAKEEVLWTHLKAFTPEAQMTAQKWDHLWQNRIHIEASKSSKAASPVDFTKKAA